MSGTIDNKGIYGDGVQIVNPGILAVGDNATATGSPAPTGAAPTAAAPDQAAAAPRPGERYLTVIALDIEGFNRADRDDQIREWLRGALHDAFLHTLDASGAAAAHRVRVESTGDGWWAAVDETVTRADLLDGVTTRLPLRLREHNRMASSPARMRVRVAVHAGEMLVTGEGAVVGEQLNFVFRLLDSDELRHELARTSAPMTLCVSDQLYQQVIRLRHGGGDPSEFTPIDISVKETRTRAWIHSP